MLPVSAHPAAALQSTAAASTIPVRCIHAGKVAFALRLRREGRSISAAERLKQTSIFRNDASSEFVVQAQRYDGVGAVHGVGELTVRRERRTGAAELVEIVIAILDLAGVDAWGREGACCRGALQRRCGMRRRYRRCGIGEARR